ncbi:15-hydroxyprostaglandin dehydrogenase [NAD(+)]-like [Bombyx mandarina]|uniref:15-hydroxyprostaglandin dehydrogenase [NAD(+)]-like n=1 Tax=Bombyx mandarina TaxID=7092 RepID=A0A6J2JVK7_BOMMA|nr:15-hydroxyprostaglandin dehydrogenase [NAD(+)]-like [Bombyx mandarina]
MAIELKFLVCLVTLSARANSISDKDLKGKNVIVTGAARGIGYAIADNFLANGVNQIIILDKNVTNGIRAAETLKCKYGRDKVIFIPCDVTKDLHLWDDIVDEHGPIHVLVNNAGILEEDQPREMILTNSVAPIEWSLKFREYARNDKGGPGGTIVNIASDSGYSITPFMVSYISSKHASLAFSKSLGHPYNFKRTGIRIVALCPELTYTAMTTKQMVWDDQLEDFKKVTKDDVSQKPDAVGKAAVHIFKNAESGTAWKIAGGQLSVAPEYLYKTDEEIENSLN